jgi:hypothetical protein
LFEQQIGRWDTLNWRGCKYGFCQVLNNRQVAIMKSEPLGRENFQKADYLPAKADGCGQDGANSKSPAVLRVNAGIAFGIVAAQSLAAADTLSRETTAYIQLAAERRGVASYAGPANH